MTTATKSSGSAKRFGARYGRRLKNKLAAIEKLSRGKQPCPYCKRLAVKRLSTGIYTCLKCKAKFTGGAYVASRKMAMQSEMSKEEQ